MTLINPVVIILIMIHTYLKHKNNQKYIYKVLQNYEEVRKNILHYLDNTDLAPNTLRKHYNIYQAYELWLYDRKQIRSLKFPKYRKFLPKSKQVRPTALIPFEVIPTLIAAAPKPYNLMLDLLFHLGLRRSELIKLTKSDVQGEYLLLRNTKNGRSYEVQLPDHLVLKLASHIENLTTDRLFNMSTTTFYNFFKAHLQSFGIDAAPHAARATAATYLKSLGICDRDVALSLHQAEQTVKMYDKRSKQSVANQFLKLIKYGQEGANS